MKFKQLNLRHLLLVTVIILFIIYSAMRERIPNFYSGIIAGVAIGFLILNLILRKRKQN